jgi:hypothetical protein
MNKEGCSRMSRALVLVASWEDRFVAGAEAVISDGHVDQITCFASRRYEERTKRNCDDLTKLASERGSELHIARFNFGDVVQTDDEIQNCLTRLTAGSVEEVVFDVSTAPRHLIWGLLSAFSERFEQVTLQYVQAESYGSWQTLEDQDPRLVLNCSGVIFPDLPTCLIMLCGPEISRAEKMFYKFEPRQTIILRDVDAPKHGVVRAFDYSEHARVVERPFDNKDLSDENFENLCELVAPFVGQFNVVCSSFGPKLGSILLFRLIQRFPEVALSYVPAGIHNPELSKGVASVRKISLRLRQWEREDL